MAMKYDNTIDTFDIKNSRNESLNMIPSERNKTIHSTYLQGIDSHNQANFWLPIE